MPGKLRSFLSRRPGSLVDMSPSTDRIRVEYFALTGFQMAYHLNICRNESISLSAIIAQYFGHFLIQLSLSSTINRSKWKISRKMESSTLSLINFFRILWCLKCIFQLDIFLVYAIAPDIFKYIFHSHSTLKIRQEKNW